MRTRLSRHFAVVSLVLSVTALIVSVTVVANARQRTVVIVGQAASHGTPKAALSAHRVSSRPYPEGILLLGKDKKFPASAIPTVALAKNAQKLDGLTAEQVGGSCPANTVELGTWCLESAPFPLTNAEIGQNDYIYAAKKCVSLGGYLPSAAQLVGAANRVKLESTIHDSPLTATVEQDPSRGLKDQREMSSTLITTQGGSDAAGSEGVSEGALGNPRTGEPNPVPQPAVPEPETLQYVTVYSNGQKGGFAGSEPVSHPENFRCAYNKSQAALEKSEEVG